MFSTYFNQSTDVVKNSNRRCHEVDFKIFGDDLQAVEIELDPDEKVIAEAGAMCYMEDGIIYDTHLGDGSKPNASFMSKLFDAGKRFLSGESLFVTHFTNGTNLKRKLAFAAPYPGKIIPIDMQHFPNGLIAQKDSFLAGAYGTSLDLYLNRKIGSGLFGGEGFILQSFSGDGMVFIHAGGTIIEKELKGETLKIDTGCVVAFEPSLDFDIERAGNLKSMIFGGEGLFLATLRGYGKLYIQTLPFARLADRIIASAPSTGGSGGDEGSILGGFGSMFERH